jgi:DinB superfamily
MDETLPCLGILEATPRILRGLMCEMSEEDAHWKPAPDRFSLAEALGHLSHAEAHCYRARLDLFIGGDLPTVEAYEPNDYKDLYSKADPTDAFDHFEEQRESNIEFLRGLPAVAGERRAIHPRWGPISLSEMLHEWALHDLGHIRQVAEIVRARKYLAGAGPFANFYQLKP